jgi:CRP-like cAMP-binding protein
MTSILARKLGQIFPLTDAELRLLEQLPVTIKTLAPREDLVKDGDRPITSTVVLEGFACRYKMLPEGKRQIMSFLIPGDICDLQSFILEKMDHAIGALETCKVGLIPHAVVRDITETHPRIARAFWKDTLVEAAISREWLTSLGRRSAYVRIAHLLCEVMVRLQSVGLTQGRSCRLPITQADLSDATGLSVVHVNRTLQQLRAEDLIDLKGNLLVVHDWERLKEAGEFDPDYMHLVPDSPSEELRSPRDGTSST